MDQVLGIDVEDVARKRTGIRVAGGVRAALLERGRLEQVGAAMGGLFQGCVAWCLGAGAGGEEHGEKDNHSDREGEIRFEEVVRKLEGIRV